MQSHSFRRLHVVLATLITAIGLLVALADPRAAAEEPAPLVMEQMLSMQPPEEYGDFGERMVMSETWLVGTGTHGDLFGVYCYRRSGSSWVLARIIDVRRLPTLALDGETLVVGEPFFGRVNIYDLGDSTVAPTVLANPQPTPDSAFGNSVDIDDDRVVVGNPYNNVDRVNGYVYQRNGTSWVLDAGGALHTPPSDDLSGLGQQVSIDADLLATADRRSVVLYRRSASGWAREAQLTAPANLNGESGVRVASGMITMLPDQNAFSSPQALVSWRRTSGDWKAAQTLTLPDPISSQEFFGNELAILDAKGGLHTYSVGTGDFEAADPVTVTDLSSLWMADDSVLAIAGSRVAVANYHAAVNNVNSAGWIKVYTHDESARRPSAPTNVKAVPSPTYGSATVSWTAPTGAPINTYTVRAVPRVQGWPAPSTTVPGDVTSIRVTRMQELQEYQFVVQAERAAGAGPWSTPSPWVRLGGPDSLASPQTFSDPTGDEDDPRLDLTGVGVDITGSVVTVALQRAQAADVYTDPVYRGIFRGVKTLVVFGTAPYRNGQFMNQTANDTSSRIPGEDFIYWWQYRSSCAKRVFPARQVGDTMQVTLPMTCLDDASAVRVRARSRLDSTIHYPPVSRINRSSGSVRLSNLRITEVGKATGTTSVYVGPSAATRFHVSFDASSSSGIKSAQIWPFSLSSGTRPIRLLDQTCTRKSKTTSTCRATYSVSPYEIRNPDVGRWRVFAKIVANDGSVLVKDDRDTAVLMRKSSRLTSSVSRTPQAYIIDARLQGADWNTRGWSHLAGQEILLQRRQPGSEAFRTIRKLRTDKEGRLRTSVSLTARGTYRLVYYGTTQQSVRTIVLTVR